MRKYHRWISLPACLFLLMVAVTGVVLQVQQFFGADEVEKERLVTVTSKQLVSAPVAGLQEQTDRALAAVKASIGANVAVDALEV